VKEMVCIPTCYTDQTINVRALNVTMPAGWFVVSSSTLGYECLTWRCVDTLVLPPTGVCMDGRFICREFHGIHTGIVSRWMPVTPNCHGRGPRVEKQICERETQ